MNNFYPRGAIKGKEQFEKLCDQRFKKSSNLYLVNYRGAVYRIRLDSETVISYLDKDRTAWGIRNGNISNFLLTLNPVSGYLESVNTGGYVFSNFWYAWAHINHLEQSGFTIDWNFPVGVG